MRRDPKPGDYYLMPFAGKRIDLLVRAGERNKVTGQWAATLVKGGGVVEIFLPSCTRCSPSKARRILDAAGVTAPPTSVPDKKGTQQ